MGLATAVAVAQEPDRMLALRASVRIEAREPGAAALDVDRRVTAVGGSVDRLAVSDNSADVQARVPADRADEFLTSLAEVGRVDRQSTVVEDVTLEAVDLDARLRNLLALRDRLQALLDRASSVSEVLEVERELTRVQSEIDMLTGRRAVLTSRVAYATVNVRIDRQWVRGPLGLLVEGTGWLVSRLFFFR